MNEWLFLRGEWDCRTQKSIDDMDDVWIELACELAKSDSDLVDIFFKGEKKDGFNIKYDSNCGSRPMVFCGDDPAIPHPEKYTIFSRGAFPWQADILRKYPEAYKIRYSSGKRIMPEPDINYNLILVDTEAQKEAVLDKYPGANVHLLIKPAASHFKPIECEKEYDVCYIANEQQRAFKGIDWVYKTAPKDLKILHLGYHDTLNPPDNIICKRVNRIDMPKWINKCKIGIVPYESVDSCPRVIPEMIACGLPLVCLDTVNIWHEKYKYITTSNKKVFWDKAEIISKCEIFSPSTREIVECYKNNLSLPIAAQHIKDLINGR